MRFLAALLLCLAAASGAAQARPHHWAHRHYAHHRHYAQHHHYVRHYADGRPRAWCGWYMARHLGVGGPLGRSLWVARNWARWGSPAQPGPGVIVVWPHHVGQIIGRAANGLWIVLSGNDGHAVRERPRSLRGAIAFRWGV